MSSDIPDDPAQVHARLGGPVGAWNEKDKVVLKSAMPDGSPVKMSPQEARNLAKMLEMFANQAEGSSR